jgi:hypothetical protein
MTSIEDDIGPDLEGVLAREARQNRQVGLVAVASVAASFAALMILVGSQPAGTRSTASMRSLRQAESDPGTLWAAVGLRSAALAATVIVGLYLVRLIGAREQAPRTMRALAVLAPVALIAAAIASQVTLLDAAHTFMDHGARTEDRAKALLTDSAAQRISSLATIGAAFAFSVWLGWTALAASRVGLVTKFMGYFGVGGAVASVIVPVAGQGMVIGWLGSIGILLLGWWPGGRGPAWTTGQVGPWNASAAGMRARRSWS